MCSDASKATFHLSLHENDCSKLARPFGLKILSGPAGGPFPLASSYRLQSMACSPVMHSNSARLVVTLSLPRAGRWRWWNAPAAESAAAPGLAAACGPPAVCPLPALGPAGRHLALCGQATADIPPPNYRHSAAGPAGAGRLTAVRVTHSA